MKRKLQSHRSLARNNRRASFFRKHLISFVVATIALAGGVLGVTWSGFSSNSVESTSANVSDIPIPSRVISLAPSITELVYALGVDSALVAVTRYCNYPPQADTLPEVGGFLDPNLELIVSLDPDLVILLKEYDDLQIKLGKLRIPLLTVDHQSVDGILESYTRVGQRLGVSARADSLVQNQRRHLAKVEKLTSSLNHPKTLISIGHSDKPNVIRSVYAAGDEGFYSELVRIAGGVNVVAEDKVRYPVLGPEALSALAPEIVLDVFPESEKGEDDSALIAKNQFVQDQWRSLSDIPAVRNNRVIILQGGFFVIPGPRFIEILDRFVLALHPEISQSHLTD